MKITKNQKIILMKMLAQLVSTYHMIDVLGVYGPIPIAIAGALSIGIGEYLISQEYASIGRGKLRSLLLKFLVFLSIISVAANVESTLRYIAASNYSVQLYMIALGVFYSIIPPAIIITTSFIKLHEPKKDQDVSADGEGKAEKVEEAKQPVAKERANLRRVKFQGNQSEGLQRVIESWG